MINDQSFKFEISLSVLNHLGRNLYRNFSTVVGEAISNAWDADAKNVWIYVDKDNAVLLIKDDGIGMSSTDFQDKFLTIGYSKRKAGDLKSPSGRPFIGRKGIGKLALLSCASKIAIITKTDSSPYVGGIIDNSELDKAITDDMRPDEYSLEILDESRFDKYIDGQNHGTIIYFENIKEGIRNSLDNLKKIIALNFRFSLIDESFNIYVEDELVDSSCLNDLIASTEFLWKLNDLNDSYVQRLEEVFTVKNEIKQITVDSTVKGFVASVKKPRNLNIIGTGEQVKVDLFVNGRLRERDILRHIPSARITESYLYGQIHFDVLDEGEDRFTSSRESVVADDPLFEKLLKFVKEDIMRVILSDWDNWRRKHNEDGDADDKSISRKSRKSGELFNAVAKEYRSSAEGHSSKHEIDEWVDNLSEDARFSFTSFAECYIGENLLRRYIKKNSISLKRFAKTEIAGWKQKEINSRRAGNINIDIRKLNDDLSYLDMAHLAKVVDGGPSDTNNLQLDSKQYKPLRDALMHTALLSEDAKMKLTTVFDNIKARVKMLLQKS